MLSNNCGGTSQSDGDDSKGKRQSGVSLSEASTTRKQYPFHDRPIEAGSARFERSSFFGIRKSVAAIASHQVSAADMEGLEELWQASRAYADSWETLTPVHRDSGARCKQQ